jgi:hypothetical protein
MERAKRIMQDRGVLKGMKEILGLPEELKPEIAESFGDLLLKMVKPDYAIAAYNIAGSSQKLMHVGDVLLESLEETRRDHENYVKHNKPRPGLISAALCCSTYEELLESTSYAVRCLAAYSLAKDLDASTKEKFEALRKKYAVCADDVKKYLAACESVKSGDLKALHTLIQIVI